MYPTIEEKDAKRAADKAAKDRAADEIGPKPSFPVRNEDGSRREWTDEEITSAEKWDRRHKALAAKQHAQDAIDRFSLVVGPRYKGATLESYIAGCTESRDALDAIKSYAANFRAEVLELATNIVLFGSPGTGKDHLLIGLAKLALAQHCGIQWVNGADLHASIRATFGSDGDGPTEEIIIERYTETRVLILSDPVPPAGGLTDFQATTLYRIIDARYRAMKPTWTTLNVKDVQEARQRLGAATVDRLRDGAIAIHCNWPSYRKARK